LRRSELYFGIGGELNIMLNHS